MAAMDEEKEGKQEEKSIVTDAFFCLSVVPRSQIVRGSFPGTPRS